MRAQLRIPVSLEPDPVIEAYKEGIDVTLLDENLKLTIPERVRKLQEFVGALEVLRIGAEARRGQLLRNDAPVAR